MKRKTTVDDVRDVVLSALADALDDGKQEAKKKPGLTGVRAVATGAVLYTAGRAAVAGRRFYRDRFGADANGAEEQEDDGPDAEAESDEEEYVDEDDDEPRAEEEDEEPTAEEDDDEPQAESDEDEFADEDEEEPTAEEDDDEPTAEEDDDEPEAGSDEDEFADEEDDDEPTAEEDDEEPEGSSADRPPVHDSNGHEAVDSDLPPRPSRPRKPIKT